MHVARPERIRRVGGVPASDFSDMFVELAELLTLVDLVVVGDNLVRRGWLTPEELVRHCEAYRLVSRTTGDRTSPIVAERARKLRLCAGSGGRNRRYCP